MPVMESGPLDLPAREAEENLRVIRSLMERSTRYSTFSGPSGILAGLYAILGCFLHWFIVWPLPPDREAAAMVVLWSLVVAATVGTDYILTKRQARLYGKYIRSHLGRQILSACAPGLVTGIAITLYLLSIGRPADVFPFWMLCYGAAVSAVGIFSQREVGRLGRLFLAAGLVALVVRFAAPAATWGALSLILIALSFGGFHIAYGLSVSGKDNR